ncbi:MAG: hypothetical protein JSU70_05205, partial [Phycisphaerales bacterium]
MAEELKDLRAIFLGAVEIQDPEKRKAYLGRACKGKEKLRAEIEDLLKAHEEAGSFMEVSVSDSDITLDESRPTEGPGTRIGRYKLLQLIGEG